MSCDPVTQNQCCITKWQKSDMSSIFILLIVKKKCYHTHRHSNAIVANWTTCFNSFEKHNMGMFVYYQNIPIKVVRVSGVNVCPTSSLKLTSPRLIDLNYTIATCGHPEQNKINCTTHTDFYCLVSYGGRVFVESQSIGGQLLGTAAQRVKDLNCLVCLLCWRCASLTLKNMFTG